MKRSLPEMEYSSNLTQPPCAYAAPRIPNTDPTWGQHGPTQPQQATNRPPTGHQQATNRTPRPHAGHMPATCRPHAGHMPASVGFLVFPVGGPQCLSICLRWCRIRCFVVRSCLKTPRNHTVGPTHVSSALPRWPPTGHQQNPPATCRPHAGHMPATCRPHAGQRWFSSFSRWPHRWPGGGHRWLVVGHRWLVFGHTLAIVGPSMVVCDGCGVAGGCQCSLRGIRAPPVCLLS